MLEWYNITTSDLPTLEIRFLGWGGNNKVANTDFVKLYVSWGGQDPTPPPPGTGSVTVDGRLKLSEEPYSYYKRIAHPQTPGDLYFYHDTTGGMCYYLLEVDRDFNDNVFSPGQGTYLQSDGWNQGHDFFALWESDNAHFTIYDGGPVLYDFYLGYLGDDGVNWLSGLDDDPAEGYVATDACTYIDLASTLVSSTSLEWDLENSIYASTWSPPYDNNWESPALDYNYTNGLGDYWEFRMIYELGFPHDCGCGDADVADAHNSPSKHEQFDAPWASIGDYVWHDEDKDGLQDTGEYGLEGIVVHLYKETAPLPGTYELIRTSETDSRGWYEFSYLDGGDYGTGINYYVDVAEGSLPTGYSQTQITSQNRSNPPPDGDRFIVNLEPGDAYREADFGYANPPTAVTLASFTARANTGAFLTWPWMGLAGLVVLAMGGLIWMKQRWLDLVE